MAISVVMPALEMAQETGKLVAWLKKEGEHVSKGEMLLEVETDKAVMEVESPAEGLLVAISAQPGAEIQVGKTIAWIVQPGEKPPLETAQAGSGRQIRTEAARKPPMATADGAVPSRMRISPKARRLAEENGVDLSAIRGTGPEGEIVAADVLETVKSKRVASSAVPLTGGTASSAVSRLMAERTTQGWTSVPHFFLVRDVDAESLNCERKQLAESIEQACGVPLTITDLLVAKVARALVNHPQINASWIDDKARQNPEINIALAMAVEGGVVAPVIHGADRLELSAIAVRRATLAQRAREGKLRPADISGGTFTISNLGMFDVDAFTAIITPPQSAILAVGRIAERAVAIGGKVEARPMMTITLSSDHRVIDGARAARFMKDVAESMTKAIVPL